MKRIRLSPAKANYLGIRYKGRDSKGNHERHYLTDDQKIKMRFYNQYKASKSHTAKILVLDIETAPIDAYTWGIWKQNVNLKGIKHDWFILTWSAKWLFSDNVMSNHLTKKEALKKDDKRITENIFKLICDADIVIAHNGDRFDLKRLNTRFLLHGLGSPTSYKSIDTLKSARKFLSFSSNKLDYIGDISRLGNKIDTGGFDLWLRCLKGDQKAFKEMVKYCDQDVQLLEYVYLYLISFIKPHPNLNLFAIDDVNRCTSCSSDDIQYTGDYHTTVSIYDEYRCNCCGSTSRSRKSMKRNDNVKSSLPR